MKRITLYILSAIILVALAIGFLPPVAAESQDDIVSGSNYHPLTTQVGESFTFTVSATDPDNNPLIYSASNLPPGATFDPQTRTFSWTPGYDQVGIYPDVHFEVSDGELTDSEDITITVISVDRPPVLDFIGDKLVNEEELVEFTINARDPDDDPLTYSASNLPMGAMFNPQTRIFSWQPCLGQRGSYRGIHFEVSDGELTDFEDINITVNTQEEAVFLINSLRVRPGKVHAGKKVSISILVTNIGTVAGSYEVTLSINGIIEDNKIVTLPAGATEDVNFFTTKDIAGTYIVDVNGLFGSFEVREENKGHGRAKIVSIKDVLLKTFGWIRMIF